MRRSLQAQLAAVLGLGGMLVLFLVKPPREARTGARAPVAAPPVAAELPAERHRTKAEWDAIVAAADRSSAAGVPPVTSPLSVDEAYAQIPHRRTRLDPADPALEPAAAAQLRAVFARMDDGVRVRVHGLGACRTGQCATAGAVAARELRGLARAVEADPAPTDELRAHAGEVAEALRLQAAAFEAAAQGEGAAGLLRSAPVRQASGKLRAAWRRLERGYPAVSKANHDAFFDHHCALDFL
jgi:hypothetical protein